MLVNLNNITKHVIDGYSSKIYNWANNLVIKGDNNYLGDSVRGYFNNNSRIGNNLVIEWNNINIQNNGSTNSNSIATNNLIKGSNIKLGWNDNSEISGANARAVIIPKDVN